MGVQGHFVTGKFGVSGDLLAALFGGVPAVQRLVVRIVVFSQGGKVVINFICQYRFVLDGALVAVAVKVDGDALHPVGVEGHGSGVSKLVLVGDLSAALGCVIPAVKDPAGAGGVWDGGELGAAVFLAEVVVVLSYNASSLSGGSTFIVEVDGDRNGLTLPGGAQSDLAALLIGQVLCSCFVPTIEIITGTGEGTLRQGDFLIIGGGDGVHGALAAVGVKGDGVDDGRPLGGEGDVLGDDRLRRQLGVAVEPAVKLVALLSALAGDQCAADRGAGGRLDGAGLAIVVKGNDGSVCPAGVQIQCFGDGHRRLVGVDSSAVSGGRPTGKDLAGTGEGVGLQGALTAVDVLGVIVTSAAVGVEGDGDAFASGEVAEGNAVVVLVAAAVLLVGEGQGVAGRYIQFHQRPVHDTAGSVYNDCGVVGESEGIVLGLGGDFVRKGQMGVCSSGQDQGTGGLHKPLGRGQDAVFDRPLQVGSAVLSVCCQGQIRKISVQVRLYGLYRNSCLSDSFLCRSLFFSGVCVFLCFRSVRSLIRCGCGSVSIGGSGGLHSAGGGVFCLCCLCDCHRWHSQRNRHDKRQQKGTDPFCHGLFLLLF